MMLGNSLKYVCSKLFAVCLHKYEQIYELYQASYCLIIEVEIYNIALLAFDINYNEFKYFTI